MMQPDWRASSINGQPPAYRIDSTKARRNLSGSPQSERAKSSYGAMCLSKIPILLRAAELRFAKNFLWCVPFWKEPRLRQRRMGDLIPAATALRAEAALGPILIKAARMPQWIWCVELPCARPDRKAGTDHRDRGGWGGGGGGGGVGWL